ncbi:piggyBac transposable element-derived protein 4-like [Lytechinus variegatus]|uniref:piggyBac transposable element-derived protein 4-like n=1 Tax=Lytechinus variegatus TaxID=7654 RepID=UPI001BB0E29D|nr:piggyBac transposable element-derived protein 4-like [Lytechinus variegatus]
MAPPPRGKRPRFFDPDEVREMVMRETPPALARADSDSDESLESASESEPDLEPERSGDEQGGEVGGGLGTDDYQHDSDSEVEDDDDQPQQQLPQQQPDMWIDLGDEDWAPSWQQNSYQERPKLLFDHTDYEPVDYFSQFFPDEVFELMATQTNLYAKQTIGRLGVLQQHSRLNKWTDTTPAELKAFIALQMAMGLVTKSATDQYWEENWLLGTPGFSTVMCRNRYQLLNSMLHLVDNELRIPRGQPGYDPLFKVQPVIDLVRPTYQQSFSPGRELAVDESLAPFKGRLSFRQFMPMKPKKFGVKFWVITDSSNGFCLDWSVYTGKEEGRGGDGLSTKVVKDLTRPYAGSGRHVYMDNFYTSPQLFEDLKEVNLGACGTLRLNRRGIPPMMREAAAAARKGDAPKFFRRGDMLGVTWHDTKRVSALSTIHPSGCQQRQVRDRRSAGGVRQVTKPTAICGYNSSMGGVDLLDQRMSYYRYPHRHIKWYMVVFHFLLEVALVNGYLAYRLATGSSVSTRKFRMEVINGLVNGFVKKPAGRPKVLRESTRDNRDALRYEGQHFAGKRCSGGKGRYYPDCVVCSKKNGNGRKTTSYYCKRCQLPMCLEPCFQNYHSPRA